MYVNGCSEDVGEEEWNDEKARESKEHALARRYYEELEKSILGIPSTVRM